MPRPYSFSQSALEQPCNVPVVVDVYPLGGRVLGQAG